MRMTSLTPYDVASLTCAAKKVIGSKNNHIKGLVPLFERIAKRSKSNVFGQGVYFPTCTRYSFHREICVNLAPLSVIEICLIESKMIISRGDFQGDLPQRKTPIGTLVIKKNKNGEYHYMVITGQNKNPEANPPIENLAEGLISLARKILAFK